MARARTSGMRGHSGGVVGRVLRARARSRRSMQSLAVRQPLLRPDPSDHRGGHRRASAVAAGISRWSRALGADRLRDSPLTAQQSEMDLAGLRRRVDTEFVGQQGTAPLVFAKCERQLADVRVAAHQQPAGPLAERIENSCARGEIDRILTRPRADADSEASHSRT